MVYGRIWLLGLYFELFPHNKNKNNNNCYQALTCAGAAGKKGTGDDDAGFSSAGQPPGMSIYLFLPIIPCRCFTNGFLPKGLFFHQSFRMT